MTLTVIIAFISAIPFILCEPLLLGIDGLKDWAEMASDLFGDIGRIIANNLIIF